MAKKSFKDAMKENTLSIPVNKLTTDNNIKENILVLQVLKEMIPPLKDDEKDQLRENIKFYGITDPLTLWETTVETVLDGLGPDSIDRDIFISYHNDALIYVLIDGHNRYEIAKELGIDFRINIMQFPQLDEVKDYMINYQIGRRNLNPDQLSYMRGLRYNHLKKAVGGSSKHQGDVGEQLAEEYNVSKRTISRDAKFAEGLDKLEPELRQDILTGKKKVSKVNISDLAETDEGKGIKLSEDALDDFFGKKEQRGKKKKVESRGDDVESILPTGVIQQFVLDEFEIQETFSNPVIDVEARTLIDDLKRVINTENLSDFVVLQKIEDIINLLKSKI